MRFGLALTGALMVTTALTPLATGQASTLCGPTWVPEVGVPGIGLQPYARVLDMVIAQLGSDDTPRLYVVGNFGMAGDLPTNGVATWDGQQWSAIPGLQQNWAWSVVAHDDGAGQGVCLFVGGNVQTQPIRSVARWDGAAWTYLGPTTVTSFVFLRDLAVYDDGLGGGPALIACGTGVPGGVAKRTGSTWTSLTSSIGGLGGALRFEVFDDGSGPALYTSGNLSVQIDGETVTDLVRWNGIAWSAVGGSPDDTVRAMHVHDDGTGPQLYIAGDFSSVATVSVPHIARWNGKQWSPVGKGGSSTFFIPEVADLSTFVTLSGQRLLVACGDFEAWEFASPTDFIAMWDGATWLPMLGGLETPMPGAGAFGAEVSVSDDAAPLVPGQPRLYVGGAFVGAGFYPAEAFAAWGYVESAGPADLQCDSIVNGYDVAQLLANWGPCPSRGECPADINDDGVVDGLDLGILLGSWS